MRLAINSVSTSKHININTKRLPIGIDGNIRAETFDVIHRSSATLYTARRAMGSLWIIIRSTASVINTDKAYRLSSVNCTGLFDATDPPCSFKVG